MRISCPLALLAILSITHASLAQTGADLMVKPWPKGDAVETRIEALSLGQGHVKGSDEDFNLAIYSAQGRYRLFPNERADPRIGFSAKYFDIDGSFAALPEQLADHSIAFGMGVADTNGWLMGASVGVGFASPTPFGDANAWYAKFDFAMGKKLSRNTELGIVIDFDGNRSVFRDLPLPGFAYRIRMEERKLLVALGFPFTSINWKPNDRFEFEAVWAIPDDLRISASYKIAPGVALFGRVTDQTDAFFWDALPNDEDRLFFEQRRVEAGLEFEPAERLKITLAAGYAWGQEFSTGYDIRDTDRLAKVSDEPYLRVGVDWRF